jgi:hypothetical protein
MSDITSNRRNEVLLHFPVMIVLNTCFNNYVRILPHQTLRYIIIFHDWFYKSRKVDGFI